MLPPDFLANMPPHIAAIAQSKPDLVRKILASKQSLSRPTTSLQRAPPRIQEVDEDGLEDEDNATLSGEEGERTELLRQRRKKPPPHHAYQSIS